MAYACKNLIGNADGFAPREKRLSICLEANGFSFAEASTSGTLLVLGEAEGGHGQVMTAVMADVKAFLANVGIRPIGYASMELILQSDASVWVPDELYSPLHNRKYLKLVGSAPDTVVTCHSNLLSSTAVFAADEHLVTAFKVALPGVQVMHQHAKMLQVHSRSNDHPVIFTHWRKGRVDVAAFRDGNYLLGNTYPFSVTDEAVYRVVEVMKAYGMENPSTELLISGEVDRTHYALLRPYFPKVTLFGGTFSVGNAFDGQPLYRHALLLI